MSRKMLWTLIVLMTLVLSGLILIQTNLIRTASDIREDQFDQMVKGALKRVVDQLELHEERVARESAQAGRLPGEFSTPGNLNVFPRQEPGAFSESFRFHLSESRIFGNFQEEYQVILSDSIQAGQGLSKRISSATSFEQLHELI